MIQVKQLSYSKHGKTIIEGINANFQAQQVHAVIGPNGSGKSTLLNCIASLLLDYSGDILWNNTSLSSRATLEIAKHRAYLTQQQNLAFPLTVLEVIEAGRFPFYTNLPSKQDKEIIEEMIELFHIENFLNRTYNSLSGGEKQRVQFARVFAQAYNINPSQEKILLLDEPLSHLDISHQFEFLEITQAFTRNHNLITLCVLHDLSLAFEYTDHSLLLNQGKLIIEGNSKEVIQDVKTGKVFNAKIELISNEKHQHIHVSKSLKI